MKKYRLKQWYPSLNRRIEKGDIATFDGRHYRIVKEYQQYEDCGLTEGWYHFVKDEVENNPDFWELIEDEKPKPLFITEDGVEVHCCDWELFGVEVSTFKRAVVTSKSLNRHSFLLFANKHKADEYIWRNKRVFSYQDMMKAKHSIILTYEDIEKAAKERV